MPKANGCKTEEVNFSQCSICCSALALWPKCVGCKNEKTPLLSYRTLTNVKYAKCQTKWRPLHKLYHNTCLVHYC